VRADDVTISWHELAAHGAHRFAGFVDVAGLPGAFAGDEDRPGHVSMVTMRRSSSFSSGISSLPSLNAQISQMARPAWSWRTSRSCKQRVHVSSLTTPPAGTACASATLGPCACGPRRTGSPGWCGASPRSAALGRRSWYRLLCVVPKIVVGPLCLLV